MAIPPYPDMDLETLLGMLPGNLQKALIEMALAPPQEIVPPRGLGQPSPTLGSRLETLPSSQALARKHNLEDVFKGYEDGKMVGTFKVKSQSPTSSLASLLTDINHPTFKGKTYGEIAALEATKIRKQFGPLDGLDRKRLEEYLKVVNGEKVYGTLNREVHKVIQNLLKFLAKRGK